MSINHDIGPIIDAIHYTTNFFNMGAVRSWQKIYAKNEDDIFEHFYEFKKKYKIEPPESLYPFFYFDSRIQTVMTMYLEKNFKNFNYTIQSVLQLLQDKDKFKRYVYYYYLEPFRNDLDIESVIKGEVNNSMLAVALMTSLHMEYPKQIYRLLYNFNELTDELISYLKNIFHKTKLFHIKKRNVYETIVTDFLKSKHVNEVYKSFFFGESIDFTKQIYAVSFFRRYIIKISPMIDNKATFILGDKCSNTPAIYANYSYITESSASFIFYEDITKEIISILKKGEKSITQLFFLMNYARPTIDKYIGLLSGELAIKISRKDGNEAFYDVNFPYFVAAQTVLNKACDDILKYSK